MLTNEAIEVHLSYLRGGLDSVRAAIPVLRDKIDELSAAVDTKIQALSEKVDAKIQALSERVDAKIEALGEKVDAKIKALSERVDAKIEALGEKVDAKIKALGEQMGARIEKANQERVAADDALSAKLDKLSEDLAELKGYMKTMMWVLSGTSIIGVAVWIAKTLHWV